MSVASFLRNWVVPQGYIATIKSLLTKRKEEEPGVFQMPGVLGDFSKWRNAYKGQRCFIVATGPSIKTQDLSKLNGENVIAVSWFHLHEQIDVIRPKWHVLAPLHPPFDNASNSKLFSSLATAYGKRDDISFIFGHTSFEYSYFNFLSHTDPSFAEKFKKDIWFLNYTQSTLLEEDSSKLLSTWDLMIKPFQLRTVIYPAIELAFYLGFSKIILVGCDHDYISDITRVENHHFYADNKGVSDKEHLAAFDLERWFLEYHIRWKDYRLMREFLESRSVSIVNATNGGMLNVFPREKFESLL